MQHYKQLTSEQRYQISGLKKAGLKTRLLRPHKRKCHTITLDNGKEFAQHEKVAAALKADIYFANPYCSWEPSTCLRQCGRFLTFW